jgi:hypothetical protein
MGDLCVERRMWIGLGYGAYVRYFEHVNNLSSSVKGGEFVDHTSEYQLLK